jgi:hypothetical protein
MQDLARLDPSQRVIRVPYKVLLRYKNILEMKEKKNFHLIRYRDGYVKKDDIIQPKFNTKKITKDHIRRYGNHTHILAKLDKCSYILINYLADHCNYLNNEVYNTYREREKFIHFCKKNCNITYCDDTVKKSFSKLVYSGMLLKYSQRGLYTVNPIYFYSGPERSRRNIIQQLIEHANQSKGTVSSKLKKSLGI